MTLFARRRVHSSPWFGVREDAVRLPDGRTVDHSVVEGPDMALVLALEGDRVHLVRQHRHALGDQNWELPSGSAEASDADPAALARRELREETGLSATLLRPLGTLDVWPSTTDRRCHVFLATDLMAGAPSPDADEADLEAMIGDGTLRDARSVAAYGLLLVHERATRAVL